MNYMIVQETSPFDLAEEVRKLIRNGWRPQGGVSSNTSGPGVIWTQAMVKGEMK